MDRVLWYFGCGKLLTITQPLAGAPAKKRGNMKVIVAGCRNCNEYDVVVEAIEDSGFEIEELVSGGADGVDALGERWAREHDVSVKVFTADWGILGRAAGPMRNGEMAKYADALVAVWDRKSPGTKNMISQAQKQQLEVSIKYIT